MIELRSDTFTLPTPRMREAMATAAVGNDGYGEDPTVRLLEEKAAFLLGKEAGLLMPSGTMANLVAVLTHMPRGSLLICGDESDLYMYEAGGASVCGGAVYTPVPTRPDGRLALDDLAAAFPQDPTDGDFAPAGLVSLENTHNRSGGRALPPHYLRAVRDLADAHAVPFHLDGARLFNAAEHLAIPAADLAGPADSVQFCLSKGLSAPVGSMLVGTARFVERARRIRKMLGGTMRQAGVIAAAGIVALDEMRSRLAEDHANARRLAELLSAVPGLELVAEPETNIVIFQPSSLAGSEDTDGDGPLSAPAIIDAARERGVLVTEFGRGRIRAVTHAQVSANDIERAATVFEDVVAGLLQRTPVRL